MNVCVGMMESETASRIKIGGKQRAFNRECSCATLLPHTPLVYISRGRGYGYGRIHGLGVNDIQV
jgi:hypothetical protein